MASIGKCEVTVTWENREATIDYIVALHVHNVPTLTLAAVFRKTVAEIESILDTYLHGDTRSNERRHAIPEDSRENHD